MIKNTMIKKVYNGGLSRLKRIKLKAHYIKLIKKFRKLKRNEKLKKVFKIISLLEKFVFLQLSAKNVYGLSRKTYYVLKHGNMSFWIFSRLVLKSFFLSQIFIHQMKGVFKILIYFIPSLKNVAARTLFIKDKYQEDVIAPIKPITQNFISLYNLYPSTRYFVYIVSFIITTGIVSPQKASAFDWNDFKKLEELLNKGARFFYNRTKYQPQYSNVRFAKEFAYDYSTHVLASQGAMYLTYKRLCSPIYYSLPHHERVLYLEAETILHGLANASQYSLSCKALNIKVNPKQLAKDLFMYKWYEKHKDDTFKNQDNENNNNN